MVNSKFYNYICCALHRVYAEDILLIENNVHERTIVARFMVYFQEIISKTQYRDYHVDCEYNREGEDPKRYNESKVYVDFILHKRGTTDNKLIIEFKKEGASNDKIDNDKARVADFTHDKEYEEGFVIILYKTEVKMRFFEKGQCRSCTTVPMVLPNTLKCNLCNNKNEKA